MNPIWLVLIGMLCFLGARIINYINSEKYLKNIRKNPKMIDRIRYLVMSNQKIVPGDLIKLEAALTPTIQGAVFTVIQDNVYVIDRYGQAQIGFIALFDEKKYAIVKEDCYKVKIST